MPIKFNSKKSLFILENQNIDYLIYLNKKNILQHIYFGKKIDIFDIKSITDFKFDWSKTYYSKDENSEKTFEDNYYSDRSLLEIGSNGDNDKRGSLISIKQKDGSFLTDFRYISHRIYKGLPKLKELPSIYLNNEDKCSSLEFTLEDILSKAKLIFTFSIFEQYDVIIRTSYILNDTKDDINIIKANSLQLDLYDSDYKFIHFYGDWASERQMSSQKIQDGRIVIQSLFGRSSHVENPFSILAKNETTENEGECFGFNFLYSGNFKTIVDVNKWYSTRVLLGINDENFEYKLNKNSIFEIPQGIIAYSSTGLNSLSQTFHDLIRNNIIQFKNAKKYRPILFNSWEGCYLDFNTQSIKDYMKVAQEIGTELFVLDDGWFGHRNDDKSSLGDWFVNKNKIDLDEVINYCHNLGMKFGIWFEPEMISSDSNLYIKHPEYALGHQNLDRALSRHQFVLDTTNKNAVEDVSQQIIKILDTYNIDYVKWDHNRDLADNFSQTLQKENQSAIDYLLTIGNYSLYEKIVRRYPKILFEGCASGGGRFDLGMLSYFPQIWCSDETDPIQRLFIQFGTSFGYSLSTIGSHVSKNPITNYKTKSNIALFGTYGYEFNPTLLNNEEKQEIKSNVDFYKNYHEKVILNGDLFRLSNPFVSNYFSMISVSKDKSSALFIFVNVLKENNRFRFIKLQGLDPNRFYKNDFDNKVYKGDYYLNVGINLTFWIDEFRSFLIFLKEAEHEEDK